MMETIMRIGPRGEHINDSDDRQGHVIFAENVNSSFGWYYATYTKSEEENIAFWSFVGTVVLAEIEKSLKGHESNYATRPERYTDDGHDSTIEEIRRHARLAINGAKKAIEGTVKVDVSADTMQWERDKKRESQFRGVVRNSWFVVTNWTDTDGKQFEDLVTDALQVDGRWTFNGRNNK